MPVLSTLRVVSSLRFFACCAAPAMLLLTGCQERDLSSGPLTATEIALPDGSEDRSQRFGTPLGLRKVLFSMAAAIEARDIDRYRAHFDQDQFHFVFDPQDSAEYGLPSSWTWFDEQISAGNMFSDELVRSIEVDLFLGQVEAVTPSDEVPLHWHKIQVHEVEFEVTSEDPEGGEEIIYRVAGGRATFFLESHSGVSLWRRPPLITEWRDHRIGKLQPTNFTTWGRIKSFYR